MIYDFKCVHKIVNHNHGYYRLAVVMRPSDFALFFGRSVVPGIFGFDMRFGQFGFQAIADLVGLALTFVDVLVQSLFAFAMANLASAVDHRQGTLDMVVAEFYAPFAFIWHMAIGTRNTPLSVYAHL